MKIYHIKPVTILTGFDADTIHRFEEELPRFFKPKRVEVGDQVYRIYTWKDMEPLIYVQRKIDEGYEEFEAWESCERFFQRRDNAIKMLDNHAEMFKTDLEFWGLEQPPKAEE